VCFTFDDGCPNQFAIAIPMFNGFGFKLTLFTITRPTSTWPPDWTALQAAASQCHEVASHTVTHVSLGGVNLATQTAELKDSRDDINSHVTGAQCVTMAYPYCVTGNEPLVGQYYIGARGCQGNTEPSTPADLMNISSIICGSLGSVKTAGDISSRCEGAAAGKGLCVFLIHGIDNDGGYSPIASSSLRGGLEYLAARKTKFWVTTFGNAVRYIRERDNVSVVETSSQDARITLQVTDPLDDSIYGVPVTLRRLLPRGWSSVNATQNGEPVDVSIQDGGSRKYVVFDAIPDAGEVVVMKAPAAPAGLAATAGRSTVDLDWKDNTESDLAGYNVYRATAPGGPYARLNSSPLGRSEYQDVNIPHDVGYSYVVTAVDANSGESVHSTEVSSGRYGDLTGNGVVTLEDLSRFVSLWLLNADNGAAGMDLDGEGTVAFPEFSVLAENWREAAPAPAPRGCVSNRIVP
jgi:oligosaccharide reducing-end xylanase